MAAADGEAAFASDAPRPADPVSDASWVFAPRARRGGLRGWRHDERLWGALAALALHVLFVWFLWTEIGSDPPSRTEMVLVFELLPAVPKPTPSPKPTPELPTTPADVAPPVVTTKPQRTTNPPSSATADSAAARPLDLSLPDGVADLDATTPERKPWERAPALATEDTRFSNDWAPEGDAAADLAWRSPTAALIMSVLGRRVPCTEKEIRLRHPRCVPQNAAYE